MSVRKEGDDYIYSSPYPARPIPDSTIYDFMFERVKQGNYPPAIAGSRIALIDEQSGATLTHDDLRRRVDALASGFVKEYGLKRGDVVAVYSPNHLDYGVVVWALLKFGAVVSGANPMYTESELAYQLKISRAKLLVAHPLSYEVALKAAKAVGLKDVIGMEGDKGMTVPKLVQIGESSGEVVVPLQLRPGEAKKTMAFLSFSSGTSGLPKGVSISHTNVIANACQVYESDFESPFTGRDDNVACACLPFFHIYGLVILLHCQLSMGKALVVMPTFEPRKFLASLKRYRINHLYLVPPMLLAIFDRPAIEVELGFDVWAVMSGAAPLGGSEVARFRKIWPRTAWRQGYGLTETSTAVTTLPPNHGLRNDDFQGSSGVILMDHEMMVVHPETLKSVKPGETGELWIRAPNVTMG